MQYRSYIKRSVSLMVVTTALIFSGCAGSQQSSVPLEARETSQQTPKEVHPKPSELNRPVPYPINGEVPPAFQQAIENETRTATGQPGKNYWTQTTDYDINATLIPEDTLLKGSMTIHYHNNSPDTLQQLFLELTQNVHKEGVVRNRPAEITGGIQLQKVRIGNTDLGKMQTPRDTQGHFERGTLMIVRPPEAVMPGETAELNIEWKFKVPQQGAGGRMGHSKDNLFYLGYWYPRMRVYDDVNGWATDAFRGNSEFYHGFGNYEVSITVPEQWMVASTGTLTNPGEVLRDDVFQRLKKGHQSDEVVHVVTEEDFGNITQTADDGMLSWKFKAENVTDIAFSATKESVWDATRTNVGDRDGDGKDDYVNINAIYRNSAPLWTNGADFTAHAISFLSNLTGLPYPWPHMTSVEGAGIIGGGMEYPMMTLIGAYNGRPERSLYGVVAHELSHMWVPMQISSNERRHAWMDEGMTTYNEAQAKSEKYPDIDFEQNDFDRYLNIVNTGLEGPIMRWSDYHYNGSSYLVATYPKPGSIFVTLRNMVGQDTFRKAYQTYLERWRYKNPYPWDLFNTFEEVIGRDLSWFWRSWFFETWELDQAVASVNSTDKGSTIVIEDRGQIPMPATVEITLADGNTLTRKIRVDTWLQGATKTELQVEGKVQEVMIDPDYKYPDANRTNNNWKQ